MATKRFKVTVEHVIEADCIGQAFHIALTSTEAMTQLACQELPEPPKLSESNPWVKTLREQVFSSKNGLPK